MIRTMFVLSMAVAAAMQGGNVLGVPDKYRTAAPVGNVVVATVNGSPIKASDVESLLWQWRGEEAIQELISAMLVAQDAKKRGVTVTDKEVDAALQQQLKAMVKELGQGASLETALKQDGFTMSRLYLRKRAELLVEKILAKDFDPAGYVKVSTIIFRPTSEQATAVADAISRAQKAYEQLQGGAAWDQVLRQSMNDPKVIQTNGLLGWRELKAFPVPTQGEIDGLAIGKFTKPVQTVNGIQIFRLEARGKGANAAEQSELRSMYMETARQNYVRSVRASAEIKRLWPPVLGG